MRIEKIYRKINTMAILLILMLPTSMFSQIEYSIIADGDINNDDAILINNELDKMSPGDKITLTGNFIIRSTIFIPSGITWVLDGLITIGSDAYLTDVGYITGSIIDDTYIRNVSPTAITEKNWDTTGASNIDMSGGTYDGNYQYANYTNHNGIERNGRAKIIQFVRVTNSNFHDMHITRAADDNFSLSTFSEYNEVRNLYSDFAGIEPGSLSGNALTDRGQYNKWFDCVAADCTSDGYTPKCSNVQFIRCVAKNNVGPGWGMFCRLGGSGLEGTTDKGVPIDNNNFIACEAYGNAASGFSFNVSSSGGAGGSMNNNYVQAVCYNNRGSGIRYRNKVADNIIRDNNHDILSFDNMGLRSSVDELSGAAGGLGTEADEGLILENITGSFVCFNNGNSDVNLKQAFYSNVTAYRPETISNITLDEGSDSRSNNITEITFNCANYDDLTTWGQQEYYRRFCKPTGCNIPYDYTNLTFTNTGKINSWSTGLVDISCATNGVFASLDVEGLPGMDSSDYIKVYYRLNGETANTQLISVNVGSFTSEQVFKDELIGETLEIIIEVLNNSGDETFNVNNISISDNSLSLKSEKEPLIKRFSNYPNPFNKETTISYNLEQDSNVSIRIYNIRGQLISTPVQNVVQKAGSQKVVWKAVNKDGNKFSSGNYICSIRINSGSKSYTYDHKMIIN